MNKHEPNLFWLANCLWTLNRGDANGACFVWKCREGLRVNLKTSMRQIGKCASRWDSTVGCYKSVTPAKAGGMCLTYPVDWDLKIYKLK